MNKKLLNDVLKLKQEDKDFYVCVSKLRTFVPEDDNDDESPLRRPNGVFIVEGGSEFVRGMNIAPNLPTPDELLEFILQAMAKPMRAPELRLKAFRAKRVFVETAEMAAALQPSLREAAIECLVNPTPRMFDEMMKMLAEQMSQMMDVPQMANLSTVPGVTVPMMAEYFESAAVFYKAEPWANLWNNDVIELRYPENAKPYYVVVMGNGGEEFGLAFYASLADLEKAMAGIAPTDEKDIKKFELFSMMFGGVSAMGFDDLDAIEKYNWTICDEDAYPGVMRIIIKKGFAAPSAKEVAMLCAAMRTIPEFVKDEMQANGETPKAARKLYDLSNVHGRDKLELRYPVAGQEIEAGSRTLSWDTMAAEFEDDDDEFDEDEDEEDDTNSVPIADEASLRTLTEQIQAQLPITFTPSKELRTMLKEQEIPFPKSGSLIIHECEYVDEFAGINVFTKVGKDQVLGLPLVFVDLDKKHPLFEAVQRYHDDCMVAAGDDEE